MNAIKNTNRAIYISKLQNKSLSTFVLVYLLTFLGCAEVDTTDQDDQPQIPPSRPVPQTEQPPSCSLPPQGLCVGNIYRWCENGEAQQLRCDQAGLTCGSTNNDTLGCVAQPVMPETESTDTSNNPTDNNSNTNNPSMPESPSPETESCDEELSEGRCNGNLLERCENGQTISYDCTDMNMICSRNSDNTGWGCNMSQEPMNPEPENTCDREDAWCEGNVLVYCHEGQESRFDCQAMLNRECGLQGGIYICMNE